ncbi:MAG: Rrf2 family transcriptional regulator [Calditrichaeota bacterium]|nr:MAG: Rrf2 family transcriptional regulator [Calditrichota bacterium]
MSDKRVLNLLFTRQAVFLSKKCIYAIQATTYLALAEDQPYVPIREIADKLKISFHFLTKILQELGRHKLVATYRGPAGGARLVRSPEEITVEEIILALDEKDMFNQCVLGFAGCGKERPCPFHERYAELRGQMQQMFRTITVADLRRGVEQKQMRMAAFPNDDSSQDPSAPAD